METSKTSHEITFRQKVVEHYQQGNLSMREIALLYGITSGTVSKWVSLYGALGNSSEPLSVQQLQSEIETLRTEVRVLKELICRKFIANNNLLSE